MSVEETISIEGTLLMLDDTTPHASVPVQVIQDGKVIATALSDEKGLYRFIDLKPGQYQVRCYTLDGYVYYQERKALQVKNGKTLENINFRFAPFKKGTWRNYNTLDGLAHNAVRKIYGGTDGMMWFGTEGGGVSRYDGKEFVNFTTEDGLAYNVVWDIYRDSDGIMWFATNGGGISRYDGVEFVNLTTEDGLASNSTHAIYQDPDGIVWFGAWNGGLSRYDGKEFVNFTTKDGLVGIKVVSIYGEQDGMIWLGTTDGISRYDGKEFVNFTTKDGLANNSVWAIYRDSDGVMWFGTAGGISRYDGKEFANLTTEDGLADDHVWAIHRDPDGVMWFGTSGGVSRYDGKGFVNFTTEDGLANNVVNAIYRDPDGVMWFGTGSVAEYERGGVSRYDPETFIGLTTKDGLVDNYVWSVYPGPDGALWLSMWFRGGGVFCYGNRGMRDFPHFVNFTTEDGLAENRVKDIYCDPDGVMWFGTEGGVSRYDGERFANLTTEDGLLSNEIGSIYRGPDGVMWFGTEGGVSRYDGKGFVNLTGKDGLVTNMIHAIHCDADGMMWFGGWSWWSGRRGGISRYDGTKFINFTTEDGLVDNSVWVIYQNPDNVMWFGTWGGVSRYDGKVFANFTTKNGLAHNVVLAIHGDPDGRMWFGTDGGGVSCYDGAAWASLDTRDGLTGKSVPTIYQDEDGSLWLATDGGITRYRRSTTPPRVRIVSVKIGGEYYETRDVRRETGDLRDETRDMKQETLESQISGLKSLVSEAVSSITVGEYVSIEYSSIDFKTLPEKRQYRCRVFETGDVRHQTSDMGLESQVSGLRSNVPYNPPTRETSFDWIPEMPGTYAFEVQAIDRDLNYSEPATLRLTVQPDPVLVSMKAELNYLRREVRGKYHFEDIIGRSAGIKQVRALMERAIDSGLTVLITGETGTGKELVAKAIHYNSPRKSHPLLDRNCGAIPKELLASDLFGHCKGAFTGANEDKVGLFEAASGGTVLLDEISEMPQDAQIHLLRVLEEREVRRLGENISRDVDVRIIAMTNRHLLDEVAADRFREDLYYRLSEFPIQIPPLSERPEDISPLAEHLLQDYSQEQKKELDGFAPGVLDVLQSYSWPGNVRELRNVVRAAATLAERGRQIQIYHFPPEITQGESLIQEAMQAIGRKTTTRYRELVDRFERRCIEHALSICRGNRSQAAKMLGIGRRNLYEKMNRLGIDIPANIPEQHENK